MTTTGAGLIIAAPASGSGKTMITLGLLRALSRSGYTVRGAKSGPDYIDPRFHEAASGVPCLNLDAWAMTQNRLLQLAAGPGLLLVEGAMGLFDGAPPDGRGATADIARHLQLPVVLVVDAGRMAQSVGAVVSGFVSFSPDVKVAGLILNRVGSARHERMLRRALAPIGVPVLGAVRKAPHLTAPSRHLGLVQAEEHPDLTSFIDQAATLVADSIDLPALVALAAQIPHPVAEPPKTKPPAQSIAIAADQAFRFCYPHMLDGWRSQGADIKFFSPLTDEAVPTANFVFLPGGYPELHAGRLAGASKFMSSLQKAAEAGVQVYGECGGYMVMGQGLVDPDGARHQMAGLLNLETSMAEKQLHLGYRTLNSDHGPMPGRWYGHEFHYATTLRAEGDPLFHADDAEGIVLQPMGLRNSTACGSFAHLIEPAPLSSVSSAR